MWNWTSAVSEPEPESAHDHRSGSMSLDCPECHKPIGRDDEFCPHCRAAIEPMTILPPPRPGPPRPNFAGESTSRNPAVPPPESPARPASTPAERPRALTDRERREREKARDRDRGRARDLDSPLPPMPRPGVPFLAEPEPPQGRSASPFSPPDPEPRPETPAPKPKGKGLFAWFSGKQESAPAPHQVSGSYEFLPEGTDDLPAIPPPPPCADRRRPPSRPKPEVDAEGPSLLAEPVIMPPAPRPQPQPQPQQARTPRPIMPQDDFVPAPDEGDSATQFIGGVAFERVKPSAPFSLQILDKQAVWRDLAEIPMEGLPVGRATRRPGDAPELDSLATRHFRFAYDGSRRLYVEDLGSLNGVYVRVSQPVRLRDGQRFRIGSHVIEFRKAAPPEPSAGPRRSDDGEEFYSRDLAAPAYIDLIRPSGEVGLRFPITRPDFTVIGRGSKSNAETHIALPGDSVVSGQHAAIRFDGAHFTLDDLRSANGTYLKIDGVTPVASGQILLAGRVLFRVIDPLSGLKAGDRWGK